jgi:TolA-binding protein
MKRTISTIVTLTIVAAVFAAPAFAQPTIDDVSKQASQLEGELGKYKDTAPEAGDVLVKLTDLYHNHGRSFGLVRAAHRFVAAHPTNPRHPKVMLQLLDGLEALTRNKEFAVNARQFLTRYPKQAECPQIEIRLAYILEKLAEKDRAAEAYRVCWQRKPNVQGREFGVTACRLFAESGGAGTLPGAQLAEEMFDKLPKNEFARNIGIRSYYEYRRISKWAEANVIGNKLVRSKLIKDREQLREIHRTMGENYTYQAQHANSINSVKAARAIRDDVALLGYQIQRLYDSGGTAASMEPVVKELINKFPKSETKYTYFALLAHAYGREKNIPRAKQLMRGLLPFAPNVHNSTSQFVSWNGTEPAALKDSEKALKAAIAKNPKDVWRLRYVLGFDIYRSYLKDNAKARQTLLEFISKSPTNDGHVWNVISWLLSTAPDDNAFRSDLKVILQARLDYPHFANLRVYPSNWVKSAKRNKALKARVTIAQAMIQAADANETLKLFKQLVRGPSVKNEAPIREKLLTPALFNTLKPDAKKNLLWSHAYYMQHYSKATLRKEAATYYGRLLAMEPKNEAYLYPYLQVATDYSLPEIAKQAALRVMLHDPQVQNADAVRRLFVAADKNKDKALAIKALAWAKKQEQKFGQNVYAASFIGDVLKRLELEKEAIAYWTAAAKPGISSTEARESAWRLFQTIEDPQAKIRFANERLAPDTDFHGRYAAWAADEYLKLGDVANADKILRAALTRQKNRPFRGWDVDGWLSHYMLHNFTNNVERSDADKGKLANVISDFAVDWPQGVAALKLLENEAPDARKPIDRMLAYQRVTRTMWPDSHRWDQIMPFAQTAIGRKEYGVAATLLTGMLNNMTNVTESRKEAGRAMIGQCYTRMGTVGLTIDENSPIAPLLQAALYLRLGDERLALETYLANKALFDEHRNEVPIDLVIFVCDNLLAAGGDENHNKVEDILRSWLIKNSELKTVDNKTKAQVQFLLAKNFFSAKRFDVARSEYTTVINRYPTTQYATEAEFGIGETFMAQKVFDQAQAVFDKLANSRDAEVIVRAEFLRGVLAHRRGDNEDARDIFRSVLERVPNIELANQALFNLSEVYGDEERYMDQLNLLMTVGRLGRVSKRHHAPGTALSIVVQDSDLGISRGHNRIPVILRTEPGGDEETVFLTSGGAGKGLFRADVETKLGPVAKNDNVLQITGLDTIKCDYPAEFKSEFKSVPLSDVEIRIASDAQFEVASSQIIDVEEETFSERLQREERETENTDSRQSSQRPTNQIKPGNPIYIRVKDGDRDHSDVTDQIVAKLVADSGDQVQVTLTETEPHSGIFEGVAKTGELPAGALASDTSIDHSPLMAIDKDPKTYWLSEPDGATPKWMTVDMKDLQTINRARFSVPQTEENYTPIRGELQASYDGEFWFTVAAHPAIPQATDVSESFAQMEYRVYSGNIYTYTTWAQVVNLVQKGEPIEHGKVADGMLRWEKPETDDAPRAFGVVWFGKFIQPREGAVRLQVRGNKTALAIDNQLHLDVGPGNRTVDVWLKKGIHQITIFSAGVQNAKEVSAVRARANLSSQNVQLSPFLTSDFDLTQAVDMVEFPRAIGEAEHAIELGLDTVQLTKKTETFAVVEQGEADKKTSQIGFWQNLDDVASWEFDAQPGVYDVYLNFAHPSGNSKFEIGFGEQTVEAVTTATGAWTTYREQRFGTVLVNMGGKVKLVIKPTDIQGGSLMNLRGVALKPATGSRTVISNDAWEFRFENHDVRYTKFVIHEYLGEAIAVNHVEISGADITNPFIPTESDVLALSQNAELEIAGGDVVTASYTDDVTQVNAGNSRLLTGKLQATYFNGAVSPIAYDFRRSNNGQVSEVRKQLKRVDPGERVVVEIVDYDRDTSVTRDKVGFEVFVNDGDPIQLTATETEENTGIFTKEVDTAAAKDGDKLVVKPGDRIFIRYLDEQNTFPGHSVPRESLVYVNRPTEGRIRVLESRVTPPPEGSNQPPRYVYQNPAEDAEITNVAFEAPLTVEVIDPDAAKDSLSEVVVTLTTTDGAKVEVLCRVSAAFTAVPNNSAADWALEEGRFIGQVVMQLGSKSTPSIVPVTADMPRNLIGGGKLEEDDENQSMLDSGLVARVLNLTGKDQVTATYADKNRPDGKPLNLAGIGQLISNGTLASVDRDYDNPIERLHVGEKLYLLVTDADQDSSDSRDSVKIQITSEFGEKETITLLETLAHSGVFTGSLTLGSNERPTPGNSDPREPVVECYFGDTLTVTYVDPAASSESGTITLTNTLPVVIGTDGLVAAFSKTFNDEKLAVETKFHIAESYFELFKSHRALQRKDEETVDLAAGRRVLREVIEDYPDPKYQPRILYLLGQFAQELGEAQEAIESYEQIVQQFPDHTLAADAQYKLAQTHEESGDFDEALEAYVTLAATYPKSPLIANVMIRISDHFYKAEEYLVAAQVGRKFIERFEGHQYASRIAFRIGQCHMKAKDFPTAGQSFDSFAKSYPDDELCPDALFWSGEAFRSGNNNREAFRRYNRCRWDFPESDPAAYARQRLALPEMLQQFEAEANSIENNN